MEMLRISSKAMFPTTMGLTMESSWDVRRVVELLAGAHFREQGYVWNVFNEGNENGVGTPIRPRY